jgi:hypothetical protein
MMCAPAMLPDTGEGCNAGPAPLDYRVRDMFMFQVESPMKGPKEPARKPSLLAPRARNTSMSATTVTVARDERKIPVIRCEGALCTHPLCEVWSAAGVVGGPPAPAHWAPAHSLAGVRRRRGTGGASAAASPVVEVAPRCRPMRRLPCPRTHTPQQPSMKE